MVFPVLVTLHIGLIHAVETIIVEHRVHLRLTGIVAGAHGVHVGLLHHLHIGEHRLDVYGAARDGVCILQVGTLEEHTLAIDIYSAIGDLHVAETILGREHMLLVALGIHLCHLYGIKVGSLSCPRQEIGERTKYDIGSLRLILIGEGNALGILLKKRTIGSNEAYSHLLGSSKGVTIVECERYIHTT